MKDYEFCVLMVGGLAKSCAIAVLLIDMLIFFSEINVNFF